MAVNLAELRGGTDIYEVYYEGQRLLGMATVTLPEFNYKTIELQGPGILGSFELASQGLTDSMEMEIEWRSIHSDLSAFLTQKGHDVIFRSAQHIYNQQGGKMRAQPVKIAARLIPKSASIGKLEQAAETESKNTFEVHYLQIEVDNETLVTYDKLNYVFVVNGVDILAEWRQAVGL